MSRAACCLLAVLLVPALSGVARASHYFLSDIDLVTDQAQVAKLDQAGVKTTEDLLNSAATPKARKALQRKTGIPVETLYEWARFCDLLRVTGLGPKMARLFTASGAPEIAALRAEAADALYAKIKAVNDVKKISELLPQPDVLEGWIRQASNLEVLLKH